MRRKGKMHLNGICEISRFLDVMTVDDQLGLLVPVDQLQLLLPD